MQRKKAHVTEYASQLFHRQHRCHAFSVSIWRQYFWLIRWDRAGAVMTEKCDYQQDPLSLYRFFYIIAQMSDTQLGWDPSVRRLREEDSADKALVEQWESALEKLGNSHHIAQRIEDHGVFKSSIERYSRSKRWNERS